MKEIIFGTTNKAKVDQLRSALKPIEVNVVGITRKLDVDEDGNSALENARKKALAYAVDNNSAVLSMDNALFLEGLNEDNQPGVHVRRISGNDRLSDEEMLEYYSELIESLGGDIGGHWEYAFVLAKPSGELKESILLSPRRFVSVVSLNRVEDYPLEAIQIDPDSGKYIADMGKNEQELFWQKEIGGPVCQFISSSLDWLES